MAKVKTYVLLEHTKPTANIYVQVNKDQRVRIGSRRVDRPHLQIGFTDRDGKNRLMRLKLSTDEIYQPDQIKLGILANEKFTMREYDLTTFRNGILNTNNEVIQKFLDAHPQNEAFWVPDAKGNTGSCDEVLQPLFKEYDETVEIISSNKDMLKRIKAAAKVAEMNLEQLKELTIKINGSHFKFKQFENDGDGTKLRAHLQNELLSWIDNTDEAGIDHVNREDSTADEQATLIVSKAIESGLISFDKDPKYVVKNTGGKNTLKLKEVPEELGVHDKQRYFIEFLISDAGKTLYDELKKEVAPKKEAKKEKAEAI